MNSTISVIGIVVAAITALGVAYMHRKQMRQVEAFRADKSVGLVPPDLPVTRWIKRHWHYLLLTPSLYFALSEAFKEGPPTRLTVLMITVNLVTFSVALSVMMSTEILFRILKSFIDSHPAPNNSFKGDVAEATHP